CHRPADFSSSRTVAEPHPWSNRAMIHRLSSQRIALSLALLLSMAPAARAWGPHGHRIATRVAEARLTPAARAAVRDLLHAGDTLVDVSTWADEEGHDAVPDSAPWHYVNVPLGATRYDARYCPGGRCVVARIKHFRSLLANRSTPRRERQQALLFL